MAALGLVVADTGSLSAGETALQSLLTGDGHSVTLVADEASVPGGIDCFVIAENASTTTVGTKYRDLAVPVVTMLTGGWDDMRMATANASNGGSGSTFDLVAHPITAGITPTSDCTMRSGSSGRWGVTTSQIPAGAVVFALHGTVATHVMGFSVDTGAALTTGTAAARRVGLGYIENWPANLTTAGQTLLFQAVDWALAASGVTGTAANTQAAQASSATGKLGYSGTSARTQASQTSSAAGKLGYTGTSARTQATQTSTATGQLGYAGTAARTQSANASAGVGQLGYSGTVARTQAAQTSTASGTVTPPPITGTAAVTQDGQTSTASGQLGYTGTAAAVQDDHTSTSSGVLGYTGIISVTQTDQVSAGVGTVDAPVTGTAATTQAGQTSAAVGTLVYIGAAELSQAANASAATGLVDIPAVPAVDISVLVGPTRIGTTAVGMNRLGSVTVAVNRVGTAAAGPSRAGTVAVVATRTGTAEAEPSRVGTVTIADNRIGTTAVGASRIERGE